MSDAVDAHQLATRLWWQARGLRARCVKALVSTNQRKVSPRAWRLEAANGARVVAKQWRDEARFSVERAVLEALASGSQVRAPRPICFDPAHRIGLLEWCGDASLPDCLLALEGPARTGLLAEAVEAFVGLERWVAAHQSFLQMLAAPYSPASRRDLAADLCQAFAGVRRMWRHSSPSPAGSSAWVREAAEGVARSEAMQPVRWGIDDLLPGNVVVDMPSGRATLVDFEWVAAGRFADAIVVFACELEAPPGRQALDALDRELLGLLEGAGANEFLARPDGADTAQVLDCAALAYRWQFIRYLLRLIADAARDCCLDNSDSDGSLVARLHGVLSMYASAPLLSQSGPASAFKSLFLEQVAL